MNTQHVTLDVDKRYDPSQVVTIGQGDSSGTTIVAEVYDNGAAVTLTGMTARFCMRLPDGVHYVRDEDCTVSGSSITYVVDEEYCASVRGRTDEAYFDILSSGSVVYSTSRFTVHVLRGVTDGAEAGESYDSAIEEAIREANEAVENANEAAEEAREAAGGTIPLMSASQRGGAKLGDGLAMSGESLGISPMSTTEIEAITEEILPPVTNNPLDAQGVGLLWTKIKQKFARLVSGAVAITQGGTGATTAAAARVNLDAAQSNGATGTLKSAEGEIDALESSLAYVESTTATANHAVGDYFMLGNVLMKATAAIATGETINASKATPATVQGQIDTLRDSVGNALFIQEDGYITALREKNGTTERRLQLSDSGTITFYQKEGSGSWVGLASFYRPTDLTPITLNSRVTYTRIGNVCTVVVKDTTTGVTNGSVLGTLPAGYRPVISGVFVGFGAANLRVSVRTDGQMSAWGPSSGTFLIDGLVCTFVCV